MLHELEKMILGKALGTERAEVLIKQIDVNQEFITQKTLAKPLLLVAFGAQSKYCVPRIVEEFDKSNMKQYEFFIVPEGDEKYSGVIIDG